MKILHVIPSLSLSHGGPSTAVRVMVSALLSRGVTACIATTDDDGPNRRNTLPCSVFAEYEGFQRIQFRKVFDFYKTAPDFGLWIARNAREYDLIHIHALFSFTSMAAAWAAHRAGVPYVLRPLGSLASYGINQRRPWLKRFSLAWLEEPALRSAAAVHFTSVDEMREASQTGISMKGVVVPLGIEAFKPRDEGLVRSKFSALMSGRYLLYLSRLDPKKNVEGLLHAFSLCAATWPDVKLLVAGDGAPAYVGGLKALARELGLTGRVVWAGHIDGELKASALAGAAMFVLPSFSENFGIAAAEALMAGLPCVLGLGVGIARDVVAAGAGVAVAPDAGSIAAGLMQVMADTQARAVMSARAVALAQGKYSAQAMGANLVALYQDIIARRQP